jgi:chromosome segregation protein
MRHALTKLELTGFKSFANKTVLEFPAGITAIVGPNGSGKSNIIDAIRWLLGEREAKNLRGGKSEDLIFAGSEKRARLSLAQATLYFNGDALHLTDTEKETEHKLIASNVSEISVMREAERNGSNRYYLNKSEVRLKDLIDFFAQARLGAKGLTVITQGNSDLFIRVSPSERRGMIEEILGLREFQIKKTDAERRLKNAQINLDKASALAEEILPHLRSLKRQTSRWEKRGELESELRNLENQFFGVKLAEISAGLKNILSGASESQGELDALRQAHTAAEKEMKMLEDTHPSERKELEAIRKSSQELRGKRGEYEREIGKLQGQVEFLEKRSEAVSVSPELIDIIKRAKKSLESALGGDLESLRSAVQGALKEIELALGGKEEAGDDAKEIKSKLQELTAKLTGLDKEISDFRKKEEILEKGQEEFYEKFKRAAHAAQVAKEKMDKWENSNRERVLEKERLEMRREELSRQITQSGRKIGEFEELRLAPGSAEDDSAEKRMFRLRGELASMGDVDETVMKEARETEERYEFLKKEAEDLSKAQADLKKLIADLNRKIGEDFSEAFERINTEFQKFFELMFGGGKAKLKLSKPPARKTEEETEITAEPIEEDKEVGVEVQISLPKKRINSLDMLSGGERSLVGIAAVFAMISVSPPPFLVLDEIDAPLDEKNARRFGEMLRDFAKKTQFIVVTHNRATMEAADVLYGVTLNEDGTSKILSMKFDNK